jgi:hypothetical protein
MDTTTQAVQPFDINQLIAVRLVYKKTSAKRRNTREALNQYIKDGELPPDELSSFGGTATVGRDTLKEQDRIEKAMRSAVQRVAVLEEDLGVYLTTEDAFKAVQAELVELMAQHEVWKSGFIASYDAENDYLANKLPRFAALIRSRKFSKDYFDKQLKAGYKVIRLNTADIGEDAEHQVSPQSLFERLMEETSRFASDLWDDSFKGRQVADRRILRPLRALQAKLHALSVLDGRIQNVIDVIEEGLNKIPEKGNLSNQDFLILNSLVLNVANANTLQKIADGGFVMPAITLASSVDFDIFSQEVSVQIETHSDAPQAPVYVMPIVEEEMSEEDLFASIF